MLHRSIKVADGRGDRRPCDVDVKLLLEPARGRAERLGGEDRAGGDPPEQVAAAQDLAPGDRLRVRREVARHGRNATAAVDEVHSDGRRAGGLVAPDGLLGLADARAGRGPALVAARVAAPPSRPGAACSVPTCPRRRPVPVCGLPIANTVAAVPARVERGRDVVADHRALRGGRDVGQRHRPGQLGRRAPVRAAVGRGDEADVELAGRRRAGGVRVVVVGQRQVRARSRGGRIDGQAGDEVVDAAADGVDRDPR